LQEHIGARAARGCGDRLALDAIAFADGNDPFSSQIEAQNRGSPFSL
jgi:hypothetical protein